MSNTPTTGEQTNYDPEAMDQSSASIKALLNVILVQADDMLTSANSLRSTGVFDTPTATESLNNQVRKLQAAVQQAHEQGSILTSNLVTAAEMIRQLNTQATA